MKYYNNILELVGNTPLVKINRLAKGIKAQVFAKIESLNPGGSVKDRIGLAMIEAAEREGRLKPGGTIVEGTSGNTGIGLALVAATKGYKTVFVMTDKAAPEKRSYLRALGAEVIVKPLSAKADSPEHYVNTARRIHEETPNSIFIYQYANPENPGSHYRTTGPEIWRDTDQKITHFVAGIGTGGTISGTSKFLKEKNPNIKVIGADPYGSIFKTLKETGKTPEAVPYLVEGIGQDVLPGNVWLDYIDEVVNVSDIDSINMCRLLAKEEGIFCGASSGTIAHAALNYAKKLGENDIMVFIICDTGERYLSKYHSDEWMREKRMLDPRYTSVGTVLRTRKLEDTPQLVTVTPDETVSDVLYLMNQYNLSTLPVLEGEKCVGSINETNILNKLVEDRNTASKKISDVMEDKLPMLNTNDNITKAIEALKEKPAVLVSEYGKLAGVITKYDVIDFV